MKKTIYLSIIALFIFQSCNKISNNKKLILNNKKNGEQIIKENFYKEYFKILSFFPDSLIDFIPKLKNKDCFIPYSTDIPKDNINREQYEYFFACYSKLKDNQIDSIFNSTTFIKSYKATDKTPLMIFSYLEYSDNNSYMIGNLPDENIKKIINLNKLKSDEYPILLDEFNDHFYDTFTGLHPSYKINIIDCKAGIYTDTTKLKKNKFLPLNWQHGYSRGINISKELNSCIFWIVVW